MKNYALLNENNIVINICIADSNWDSTGWIEYTNNNPAYIDGDYIDGYFYSSQPYPSWLRNKGNWESPIPNPNPIDDPTVYRWTEHTLKWIKNDTLVI